MMQNFIANAIVVIAVGSLGLSAVVLPSPVRSEEAGESCQVATRTARERIEQGRSITVMTYTLDHSETYPNHPNNRPLIVQIVVDGSAASSVMKSPVFQKAISSSIIKSCGSVGGVIFGKARTDWYLTLGLMPNGTIEYFECLNPNPERNKLSWGQQVCL
jgi:hypothetical protein